MGTVYLDVDGVCNYVYQDKMMLLVPELYSKLEAFIEAGHKIKWLTCHTPPDSEMETCHGNFVGYCGTNQLQVIIGFGYHDPNFEYADWKNIGDGNLKSNAVDFSDNFVWLEDGALPEEKDELKKQDCFSRYFYVNPKKGLTWDIVNKALLRLKNN